MTTLSDVFVFAAQHADYWREFLTGEDYPTMLTDEEVRGLTAAREHVDSLVVEVLHTTGERLMGKLGKKMVRKRFNAKSTAANRAIHLSAPFGLEEKVAWVRFSFAPSDHTQEIELFASLGVMRPTLEALRQELDAHGLIQGAEAGAVYAAGIPITADLQIDVLAERSSNQAIALLEAISEQRPT